MNQPANHLKRSQSTLSFKIEHSRDCQINYIHCEQAEISVVDALKDQLGFASRRTVLRWIFAQLENEDHLSRWTLEMLSKKKSPTKRPNQDGPRGLS